jgi:hypothetical protein
VGSDAGLGLLRVIGTPSDAATFARDLYAVCTPEPVLVSASTAKPRGGMRVARLAAALAVASAACGLAGVAWARSGAHPVATAVPRPQAAPLSAPAPDWTAVMTHLDAVRDEVFVTTDVRALRLVYVPGSHVLAKEAASLRALGSHHLHTRGLHLLVAHVQVMRIASTAVTLDVVDRLPAYDMVDVNGHVVTHHAGRGLHTWRITLQRDGDGWLISNIA